MADEGGNVSKGSLVELVKANRKLKTWSMMLVGLSSMLLVGLIIVGCTLGAYINKTGEITQAKIFESVTTQVKSDTMGAPHLMDKISGNELTV